MKKSKQRANRSTSRWQRIRAALVPGPGRYRIQSAAVLGIAAALAALVLYLPLQEHAPLAAEPTRPPAALPPTSTAVPQPGGPTPVPGYRAARITSDEAILIVSSQPSTREPGRTLADTAGDHWTAEYRGDGTWIVRAGEPAWLLLEDGRAAMPANVAAINLQGADRGVRAR